MRRALAPVLAASILAACSGSPGELEVVVADATAQTVEVEPEQAFVVVVETNSGIGWTWDLTRDPDPAVATFVDRTYVADEPVLPGSGGIDRFRFLAVAPGETTLRLSRDFRGEGVDLEVTITVVVRGG